MRAKRRPGTARERDPGLSAPAGISQTETLYARTIEQTCPLGKATDTSRAGTGVSQVSLERPPRHPLSARLGDCALVIAAAAGLCAAIVVGGNVADRIPTAILIIGLWLVFVFGVLALARREGR